MKVVKLRIKELSGALGDLKKSLDLKEKKTRLLELEAKIKPIKSQACQPEIDHFTYMCLSLASDKTKMKRIKTISPAER